MLFTNTKLNFFSPGAHHSQATKLEIAAVKASNNCIDGKWTFMGHVMKQKFTTRDEMSPVLDIKRRKEQ